jgi:hypothetical protein
MLGYEYKLASRMKIYGIPCSSDRFAAFEVANWRIGRRGACAIVRRIPGVEVLKRPVFLSWFREEVFCQFRVGDHTFEIEEPFGDNSRYWVGPAGIGEGKALEWVPEIELVRAAFEQA